ncbi:hypothetical protein HQQ81_19800 [Microbacteriaceae bacterium VKM Ac-2854]|nr:hypothetical protein [Microbacteriaceae bacterium VKM Ac-2854]
MTIALAVAAALAGGVLLASGILKLGRTEAFHQSLPHLGVPAFLRRTRAFARAFPFGEIALGLAILLLPTPWQFLPLLAATALFAVFFVVSVRASRAPEEVECECFGGLGDARMTRGTVVRNGVFLALALAGLLAPASPASVSAELTGALFIPLLVSALVIGVLVIRRNATKKPTPGAAFGAPAPGPAPTPPAPPTPDEAPLVLYTVDGEPIELAEYTTPPTHLVFFSADCSSCQKLVERFRWWPHALREGDELQPVFLGAKEDFADYEVFAPLLEYALYDPRRAVARRLGLQGTPGAVYLDTEHPLGRGWVAGEVAIEAVVVRPGFFEEHGNGVRAAE